MFLRVRDESGDGNPKPSMSERKKGQRFPFQSSKDDFHLHIKLHQETIKESLTDDGGTHSSNL